MSEEPFVAHRSLLFTVAYEMLGSVADAGVVQETWLRWAAWPKPSAARSGPSGVSRADRDPALSQPLRTLARQREEYVGEWLPSRADQPGRRRGRRARGERVERHAGGTRDAASDGARGFRAPRGLRCAYDEIAEALGKSPAAVRQIASAARKHVAAPAADVGEPHRTAAGGRAVPRRADHRRRARTARGAGSRRARRGRRRRPTPTIRSRYAGREARPGDAPLRRGRARRHGLHRRPQRGIAARIDPGGENDTAVSFVIETAGSPRYTRSATPTSSSGWARWPSCDGELQAYACSICLICR